MSSKWSGPEINRPFPLHTSHDDQSLNALVTLGGAVQDILAAPEQCSRTTTDLASPVRPPGPHHTAPHTSPADSLTPRYTPRSLIPRVISSLDGASDGARHWHLFSHRPWQL
jgi:hypothetical protein